MRSRRTASGIGVGAGPVRDGRVRRNDHQALGVVRALHERGRRVPQDGSVVGFDDVPESAFILRR